MRFLIEVGGRCFEVEVEGDLVRVDGAPVEVGPDFRWRRRDAQYEIEREGMVLAARILPRGTLRPTGGRGGGVGGATVVEAPLPGLVRSVLVEVGETVSEGQALVTLDAMKLENEVAAPVAGMVREVRVVPGRAVERGEPLVVLERS